MRIVFVTVLFIGLAGAVFGQNSFSFDKPQFEFDTLYEGESPNAVFLLKNMGRDTLYIKVKPDVESISVTFAEAPIYPGKCSMIQGQLNTSGLKGKFNGQLEVMIRKQKHPDEFKDQKISLPIKAYILKGKRPEVKFVAASKCNLGKVIEGEEGYFKIDFKNEGSVGLFIRELNFKGVPFFYSCGYYHTCSEKESKPLVGSNEIIKPGETGSVLLKLSRTDLEAKEYETLINIQGNFKMKVIKLKFEVVK